MKNRFLLIISLLVLGLTSCSKENESIAGTTWIGAEDGSAMQITFTQTDFELKEINLNDCLYGTYAYHKPEVTFIITKRIDPSGNIYTGGGSMKGHVNGNQLTITPDGGRSATFTRQ